MIEVNFSANIIELSEEDKKVDTLPLRIRGKAVNSGFIKNKNFYLLEDELENIVNSLKTGIDGSGAYLLKNHGVETLTGTSKNTDSLIGKITDATKSGKNVNYVARVEDADIANKIRKNLVSSSSIGLSVGSAVCSICGKEYGSPDCTHRLGQDYPDEGLAPDFQQLAGELGSKAVIVGKSVTGKEISVVLFPAVEGANAIPFSFDESTEKLITETEARKQTSILERKDKIEQDLANLIYKEITFEDVKQFAKDNDIILMKTEDYNNLKNTVAFLETNLWCRDNGIEYSSNYLGLDQSQKDMIIQLSKTFAQTRSQGKCAVDINLEDEGTKKKEDIREMIFHTRRDKKELSK
jgi:hypothetical protein